MHKFEMVRLSVSLFQLRLVIFPVSLLIFRIELVMSHEDTAGTPLDFLTSKILTELSLDEYRPMGKSIWFVSRHLPNTSEHPTGCSGVLSASQALQSQYWSYNYHQLLSSKMTAK